MEDKPCWVEVRPLTSGKFELRNFGGVLDYLYNTGKPFRFFAVNCPSVKVEGLRSVRFFLQLPNVDLADRVANVLRTSLDAEIIEGGEPPARVYERCAEFELRNTYALPICSHKETPYTNPVDTVVGALTRGDAALEVLAVEDRRARGGILRYVGRKTGKSVSFADAMVDAATGILGGFFGGRPSTPKDKRQLDPFVKERVDAAGWKVNRNLFRCELRAYGDSETVEAIGEAFPFAYNRLKVSRVSRTVEAPTRELCRPRGRELKAVLLSLLWLIPLLLIPSTAFLLGVFDPLRLANVDLTIIMLTVIPSAVLYAVFRSRPLLVLCTDELSLIVGVPTAVDRLPVETGTARITRKQFAFGEEVKGLEVARPESAQHEAVRLEAPSEAREAAKESVRKEPLSTEAEPISTKKQALPLEAAETPKPEMLPIRPLEFKGVLTDPRTGEPLANREFEVYDESGRTVSTYFTDGEGRFKFTYAPENGEKAKLKIKPRGYAEPVLEVSAS